MSGGGIAPYVEKRPEPKVSYPEDFYFSDKVRAKCPVFGKLPTTVVRFTVDDVPVRAVSRW